MTGFGRAQTTTPSGRVVLEISSVNRKYLDVSIQMPKELSLFETELRNLVNQRLHRGQILLRYTLYTDPQSQAFLPDKALCKKLKRGWEDIAKDLGFTKADVTLSFLAQQLQKLSQPIEIEDVTKHKKLLITCTEKALDYLIHMKIEEGKALCLDMQKRLHSLEKILLEIEKKAPESALRIKKKMEEKLTELFPKESDNYERVLREAVIYSERSDITEEIVRFRSHLKQFLTLLKKSEEAVVKKMDFLMQELMREINTIGAKSSDAAISSHVVEVKSELEKVREQVQNIE